jgi:putative two-component system response regulator
MAVADVYDALISRRVYKEGMPHEKAIAIMKDGRGTHFDPDVLDAFLELQDSFQMIAKAYQDSDQDMGKKAEYLEMAIAGNP